MKKNLKRWLALLLAIAMIVTSGAFTNLTYLRATDSETPVETQSEQKEEKQEAKTEEKEKEKEQKVVVEPKKDESASKEEKKEDSSDKEETKEEKKEEAASEKKDEATVSEDKKQDTAAEEKKEDSTSSEKKEDVSAETKTEAPSKDEATVAPAEAEETPAQSQVEEPAPEESKTEEAEAKTYEVKVVKPAVDGGSVKVWSDGDKADVSDGGTQTVKEGQTFNIQIATKEGYSVEKVTDQDGKTIDAKDIKDNTYSYELNDVKENKTLNISYKEEKQDEVAYPAFSHKGSKDGVTANISAPEGVFPEGTEVELKALSADDRAAIAAAAGCETSDVLGLDITFKYEGKEIQPTGDVKVSFSADEIKAADEASVYHVNDSGSVDKIGGSKDGASVGFTADSFSPYGVVLASNADDSRVAMGGTATVKVGESITLSGIDSGNFHRWNSSSNKIAKITSETNTSTAVVKGVKKGTVTITHRYYESEIGYYVSETITLKVISGDEKPLSAVTINGKDTVKVFSTISLTAAVTPTDQQEDATFTWESSDDSVLTVDKNGTVKGVVPGTATITVYAAGVEGTVVSTTKPITVEAATSSTNEADFYYLKTPTSDPTSNSTSQWGSCLGKGKINLTEAQWDSKKKNSYDNVANRVIKWPDGSTGSSYTVPAGTHWDTIYNAFRSTLADNITKNDVEAIILHPYKISNNDTYHVDCTVEIKVKNIYTATYKLWDANSTGYVWKAATTNLHTGDTTTLTEALSNLPKTKTVDGVQYTLFGWYDNEALKGERITFPYTIKEENVNFYAKYVAGYNVTYDLNGGTWDSNIARTYFKNVGDTVYVINAEPTRDGYTFKGWKKTGDNDKTYKAGDSFTMPESNVTLTAQWEPNEAEYTVNYYWNNSVLDSKTVSGYKVGASVTESPEAVNGYTVVSSAAQTITLGANATQNVINFYYYKNVTLTANSAEFKYDGTEKSVDGYTASEDGVTFENVASVGATGTNVGEYPAAFAKGTVGKIDTTEQYIVAATVDGRLKITPNDTTVVVTITEHSGTGKYNGREQTVTGYDVSIDNALYTENDFTFSGDATIKGTDADTYEMNLQPSDFKNVSKNFSNVTFVIKDGTLVIEKRDVTLISGSASKPYDGTALTKDEVTVDPNCDGFVDGEGATYKVSGSQTEAGSSDNKFEYTLNNTKEKNYTIKKQPGKLTVTADPKEVVVTITEKSDTVKYNGTTQSITGYEITDISNSKYLKDYVSFVGDAAHKTAAGKDAGTYEMGLKPTDFSNTSKNFDNVTFVIVDGTLTIEKRKMTLTSDSAERVYNGEALVSKNVTEGGDGFVDGEGADYSVTGSQTNVGESDNTFTYTLKAGTNEDNYDITPSEGKLKVTPVTDKVTVTITEHSDTFTYDGSERTVKGYDVSSDNSLYTEKDFSFNGNDTVTGKNAGTYDMQLKASDFTNISKNFTNVEFKIIDGQLKIEKRNVTLTSGDGNKTYDGQPLTNGIVTVGGDKFAPGEGTSYKVTGSQTNAGSSENAFTYTLNSGTDKNNYNITTKNGTLTVDPIETEVTVTITGHTVTAMYDGEAKTAIGYDTATDNTLYTANSFRFTGINIASRIDAGSTAMGLAVAQFENTDSNFTNVTFIVTDGGVTVTPRKVKLTSATDSKPYDGTALTNHDVAVSGDGFVDGQGATYAVTGTQTEVGSSENTFTYTLTNLTNPDNYTITTENGTLTVTKDKNEVIVTIKGKDRTVKYDGTDQTVTGYDVVSISNSLYTAADFTFTGTATATGKKAGSYPMGLTAEDFTNASDRFDNVTFKVTDGTLTIEKRTVTLTSPDAEKVYDGQALTSKNIAISGDGFVDGEGASYDVTGSQTVVGTSGNTFTYTLNDKTDKDNYTITKTEGTLEVKPVTDKVTVTIKENDGSATYDGTEKTATGYTVKSISNTLYTEKDFTFSGDATAKGTDAGSYDMNLTAADFTNTNTNFTNVEFKIEDGQLTINPRPVTLTSTDDEKVYDGTALKNDTVEVGGLGFVSGQGATYDVTGSQTDVGTTKNAFTYELKAGTKASNYTITKTEGTLEVTPVTAKVTVTITEHSGSTKYDGKDHTVTGYDVAISNALYKTTDFTFNGKAEIKGKNAGTYDMELKPENFANISKNFTNVEFVIIDGQLKIEKRNVTLTSASQSKVYDGTPLTNDTVEVSGDGFADGEGATYTVTGSRTVEGSSPNTFTYKLNDNTDANNYNIDKKEGTLTITKSDDEVVVTIAENSGSFKYDGDEKTVTGYTVKSISNKLYKETDFTFKGDATIKGTDAGTYQMNLKPADFVNNNTNFKTVTFKIEDGELTITPREVTLTSASASKTYDGTALTNGKVTVDGDGFAKNDEATYDVTGSQTEAGSSDNTFTYKLNAGTNPKNYTITKKEGTLKVDPVTEEVIVKIKGNKETVKYDASEKTASGYTTAISNSLYSKSNIKFAGSAEAKGTNANIYKMGLKASDFSNTSKNFTNVRFEIEEDGQLEITKRDVTLTSEGAEKVYDGKALTNPNVKVTGDGFATGEGATYDVTGTQTDAGESQNTFGYTLDKNTLAGNYNITPVTGTLKVTPVTEEVIVNIKEHSGSELYDGTAKTVTGYDVTKISNALYTENDFTFNGDATVAGTNAGTYDMNVKATDFKNVNGNFTNVSFVVEDGTLVIAKRKVTLTSASDNKVYDGQPLTNPNVTVTGDGFAEGEDATYDVTGSQTTEGSSDNSFTYELNSGTSADNYEITPVVGKLTVTASEDEVVVTITENSGTELYDGTEKTVKGYRVTNISNPLYKEADFSFNGNAEIKGTDADTYQMDLKPGDFINNNKNFKKVTFQIVDGTLTIEKRTVVMTSASQSKVYDGTALTNDTVTVTGDGFADGEGATYSVTGSQLNVGSSDNTFTYALNSNTKAGNYTITTYAGELAVTPVTDKVVVTIKGHKISGKYDGTEKTAAGYDVSIDNKLYTAADFAFSGNAEVKATDAGDYAMGLKESDFRNTSKNFTNVEFKVEDGSLAIAKRSVLLRSETASKTYDGTALTKPDVTVTGDGFVDGEVSDVKANGSVTYVEEGKVTNDITYTKGDNFKESNYEIVKEEGKLHIEAITTQIIVTAQSDEKVYDGTPLTKPSVTYTANVLLEGDSLVATVSGSQTDAGSSANVVISVKVMRGEQDVTANYTFGESQDGTLKVTPREIELTSGKAEKTYDGTPLTKNEVTVTKGSFVDGEGFDYDVTGSQTYAGNSANTFTYTAKAGTKLTNYAVTKKYGTLNVKLSADEITIKAPSDSKMYDGTPLTLTSGATYTGKLAGGDVLRVTLTGSQTDYGTSAVTVAGYRVIRMVDGVETDVTANYKFGQSVPGTLSVTKRKVTLTSGSGKKTYDGTPLTNETVTVSGDGFADGEGAVYNVSGSQLDAGKSENTFGYTLNENTNPANYEIETVKGDLIVDPIKEQTITITANSANKTYDGTPLTDNGYTYTEGVLVSGDVLTAVVEGSVTNVDDADNSNVVTSYKVMRGNTDVTKNYTFTASVNGTLTINPRSITLTSATDEKPYDGTPLTNATITVSDPGFVVGEGATYDVTGTQTLVGSSENTFTYELNEGTREANYVIETAFGTLTVSDEDVDPTTVVTKTHADKADGGRYDLGQTVTFTITVTNPYDTAKTITLTEQGGVTLKDTVFENVAPGATVSTTATYTITEADVKAGSYHNEVTAAFSDGKSFTGEDTVEVEDGKAHLTVIKVASTTQPEGGFKLGDTIEYSIKVKNDGNLTVSNIEVTDDLTGEVLSFGTVAGHTESEPQTVRYTVTEKDILSGKIINNATVTKAEDPDGNTPETTPGKAEVTTEPARPVLIVNKTVVGKTSGYELGETATYTISVTNDGNVTVKNVWVTDDLTGQKLFFGTIAPGETVPAPENPTQITYTITEQDILNGKVVNVATVTKAEPAGGNLETAPGTATITTVVPAPGMKINKRTTSTAPKGGYKVGDTITYAISVTNTGNVTLKDVKVSDALTGNVGENVLDFGTIAPNDTSKEITVSYVVTEADVSRGRVINDATGTATDPKGNEPEVTPGQTKDDTEPKNSHITVTKKTTSTMPEGGYKLGDTITYEITVKNDGNQTLTNVQITDDLANLVKDIPADWTIENLGIGESKTVTAQYVVTEADIRNGKVINDATVKGAKDPDGEDPTITPGKTEDDTVPKNSHITVTKKAVSTPKDPAGYGLGEEIKYEILVENDGNQTLTNVVIADSLAGIVKDVPADWTIPTLAVGDKVKVTATYTVTEADIRAGKVHNEATISDMTDPDGPVDPDPEDPEKPKPVTPGTDDQPTVKEESSLFISKTADQTSGLKAGDVVTYTILVVNNGNQTIKDIVVADDLTGDSFDGKILGLGGITLKPGERKEFTVRYTITEKDVINGGVTNVATVTGTDPNGSKVDEKADETVDTQLANPNYTVTKTVDNPQAEYKVGDVINYTIKVTNTGNLTLNNLVVKDQMQGTDGTVVIAAKNGVTINGTTATIAKLAVGASIELKASYTVVRADADSALSNKVNVTTNDKPGTDPKDPDAPDVPGKEDETDPTPTEKTYVLTIHYVDANGNVLAPDYTARLLAGETIDAVVSPEINGYTPNFATVALPANGMPARDVTVTVVYTANPVVVPDDPQQPNNPNNPNPNNGGGGNEVNDNGGNNGGNNPANPATPADNTPVDGVIQPNDDGGYELTPVEDGQTPLANLDLDDHACCILHFLIMLLTLIIFAIYTKSRKNRQMKVEELREQLALTMIQKELELSDEEMAKYLEEAKKLAEEKKQANA